MRSHLFRLLVVTGFAVVVAARTASAQICLSVDTAHDMLSADDRTAALILLTTQFEQAGEHVVDRECAKTYVVSHVRLGSTITVTMSGPNGRREGKALDLDDLPPLYNQMVRAMLTGQPIGSLGVVDRTNVTAAQNLPQRRLQSDSFWYARLGYSGVFADQTHGAPAFGFGYRAEFDKLGVDFSFFNYAISEGGYYGSGNSAFSGSTLKLQGMYFADPLSNSTPYFGGGMSWGHTELSSGTRNWRGSGLQGDLTAGYEIGRATSVRLFLQADAVLPFYNTTYDNFTFTRLPNGTYNYLTSTDRRYTPSLVFSIGIGWQKGRL
jgi:hypothetical protein